MIGLGSDKNDGKNKMLDAVLLNGLNVHQGCEMIFVTKIILRQ